MPEDIRNMIEPIKRIIEAFKIPILMKEGYEADDVIGTLARMAEKEGFTTYMMTPDKDFGQLVTEKSFMYKRSEEHTSELQSRPHLVCRLLLEKKKKK